MEKPIRMLLFALAVTAALHCGDDDHPVVPPPPSADTAFARSWPVFSRDGRKIYFIGKLFGLQGSGLYEADTSGGAVRLVRWDSLDMADPRLSPDGTRFLYQAAPQYRLACCAHLWVMNVDGSGAQDETPWGGFWQQHQWSPDGGSIVGSGPVEEGGSIYNQILRMNADGTGARLLTRGDSGSGGPRYDRDGSQIFYVTKHPTNELSSVVYVMNADGSNPRPIDSTRAGGSFPRPSPVRKELALLWQTEASAGIGGYIMAYDSLHFPAGDGAFRRITGEFSQRAEWSPDGTQLGELREGPAGSLTNDLYLIPRDGSGDRRLTMFYRISFWSWSPDGRQIVFSSWSEEPTLEGFFLADVQTMKLRKLTIHR